MCGHGSDFPMTSGETQQRMGDLVVRQTERLRTRAGWLGAGVFVLSLGLLLVRFLVPRPVGVTDNGDGWRLLCQVGANDAGRPTTDELVRFAYQHAPDCGTDPYVSTQVWFAKAAQWIGDVTGAESALNVLIIGVLCCVVAAAGVTAVVLGLPMRARYRLVAGALVLLLLADSAFFGYFASVLTEGPAFLGIVLMVGGLLLLSRDGGWRYAGAAVTVLGALIGVNAKGQTVLILPLLAIALLLLRPAGRAGWATWLLPIGLVAVLTAGTVALQTSSRAAMGENTERVNVYNTIFNSIVDGRHDTGADLAALGLPRSYERYVGTRYWWRDSAIMSDPDYERYADRFTRANLVDYYMSHPGRTAEILHRAATDLMTARPDYQGNFGTGSGQPPTAKEYRVPVLSGLLSLAAPLGLFLLFPLWLLTALAGIRALRLGRRELGVVLLFVLGSALGQFLIAALAEGVENVKHQVIALFCTLFGVLLTIISRLPRAVSEPASETPDEAANTRENQPVTV